MAPEIPKGSLVAVVDGSVEVDDAAAYHSVEGTVQVHRVVEVVHRDGQRYYRFQGDANQAADSWLVPEGDVIGPVEGVAPTVGYAWLLSSQHQVLMFAGLLAFYLCVTGWDARRILTRARWKVSAVTIALLVATPGALAAVVPVYPDSHGGTAVQDPATLKWDPGPVGSASIGPTNATATATVDEPKLFKETVLWGCDPETDSCTHKPSGSSYAAADGSLARVNASQYAPTPTFFMEAYLEAPSGGEAFVRLFDNSSGAAVTGSELSTTATSPTLVRSTGFTLSGTSDYQFQTKVTGASGGAVTGVKLVAMQPRPEDSVTRPKVASASETTSTSSTVPDGALLWQYDGSAMDGVTAAHLEFVAHVSEDLTGDSQVHLVENATGDVITSVNVPSTATSPTLFRSSDVSASLVAGRDYQVQYERGSGAVLGDNRLDLHIARMVVQQDGFSETVQYTDLSWETSATSTSYVSVGYPGRYEMDSQWDDRSVYFEVTLADDTLSTESFARLYDNGAGAAISGSEVSVVDTTRQRLRSGTLTLNTANVTYDAQIKTGGALSNALLDGAWIVTHVNVSGGRTFDHVLETDNDAATCTWDLHLETTSTSNLARLDLASISIDDGTTTEQVRVEDGSLTTSSGAAVAVSSGNTVQYVVEYDAGASGSSTIQTDLVGSCQEAGVSVRESVDWTFE